MDQTKIASPAIINGPWRSILPALRLHIGAMLLRNLVWLLTGNGKDYDTIVNISTPGLGNGRVRCAVCRPKVMSKDHEVPLVLVLQGGGFVLGQPEDGQKHDRKIADEIFETLKWAFSLEAKTRGIHIDPSHVAVMGNSAGGNLTAALSLLVAFTSGPNKRYRADLPQNFEQKAQILLYPSVELSRSYGDRWRRAKTEVQDRSLPIGVAEFMEDSYLPPHINRTQIFIAPVEADKGLLSSLELPQTLILTAGLDCLRDEAETYAQQLTNAGVTVKLHNYPQAIHGFSHYTKGKDFRPDDVDDCLKRIHETLKTSLQAASPSLS